METYWHEVNGQHYTSRALLDAPTSLEDYKARLRRAYGTLRGVKVGIEPQDVQGGRLNAFHFD